VLILVVAVQASYNAAAAVDAVYDVVAGNCVATRPMENCYSLNYKFARIFPNRL
jgi:hypothetical protein